MINFRNTKFIKSAPDYSYAPKDRLLPEILFVGKSNVGKSTLLNLMSENKGLAKVSSTPGATKWNGVLRFLKVVGGKEEECACFGDDFGDEGDDDDPGLVSPVHLAVDDELVAPF